MRSTISCISKATAAVVTADITAEVVPRVFQTAPSGAKIQKLVIVTAATIATVSETGEILRCVIVRRNTPKTMPEAKPDKVKT